MNREQAENILEAYVGMECNGGDNKTRQSLREVILDAMTECCLIKCPIVDTMFSANKRMDRVEASE